MQSISSKLAGLVLLFSLASTYDSNATLGLSFPAATEHSVIFGSVGDQGAVGFNLAAEPPGAGTGKGHVILSQNVAPAGSVAYYYITGRERSPQVNQGSATAQMNAINGFGTFAAFVGANGLNLSDFTYSFGQSVPNEFTSTWNLGSDTLGVDYWHDPGSTIEERIYTANPGDVSVGLSYQNTPWINFGYTDVFMIIDYQTTSPFDDQVGAYSNPVGAFAAPGLDGLALGAATAFLADVAANGGAVQLRFDSVQPAIQVDFTGPYSGANFTFGGAIQIVPEPSTSLLLGLAGIGLVVTALRRKRR